ncbi:histone H3 Lys 36 methyltransferase [Raphidocelis subcapitata]|uniref:Histone H3 Lys 36 methyltransferase n=1 Tax=Raphidocelis subcapitata TaxID=307507 RepID=A0A2V0NZ46_9CHLO|nr:histone H3 Lys 36 methyltransferase [Raphidocelis subcapitata]|eukprot:GBF90197.1 histone H3 Lys 36 methyltransferase [Raphidocelis subcapitata]
MAVDEKQEGGWYDDLAAAAVVEGALASGVVWARVRGFPAWPAQVLSAEAAETHLGAVPHKNADTPVVFFGTSEIAWVGARDAVPWGDGMAAQLHAKGRKIKRFVDALNQVRAFLSLAGPRASPDGWWCPPPSPGPGAKGQAPRAQQGAPQQQGQQQQQQGQQQQQQQQQQQPKAQQPKPGPRQRVSSGGGGGGGGGGGRRRSSAAGDGGDDGSDFENDEDRARRRRRAQQQKQQRQQKQAAQNGDAAPAPEQAPAQAQAQAASKPAVRRIAAPPSDSGDEAEAGAAEGEAARLAAAGGAGWARAFDAAGRPMDPETGRPDASEDSQAATSSCDEGDEVVAAAAAATAAAAAARLGAAGGGRGAAGAWAHAVAAPCGRGARGAAAVAAPPLTPFEAVRFAEMAGPEGAAAAVPAAAALSELPGLSPAAASALRARALRDALGGAPPLVGALAALAAAFPGGVSGALNAAAGRRGAVDAAAAALREAFGAGAGDGPSAGSSPAGKGEPRPRSRNRKHAEGPSAEAAAAAAAAAQAAALAEAGVPAHLAAIGPTVRVGGPGGPRFEMVKRNAYPSKEKPKRLAHDDIAVCNCSPEPATLPDGSQLRAGCGEACLNRVMKIHCDPKTCPCGEGCSNRPFHLLEGQPMEVFLTANNRGHGVRAVQPIPKGAFVVEYAGEVIDSDEMEARMDAQRLAGQHHFYIMGLGPGLFIDALRRGNYARLLNSSCEPNCETQKWYDAATGEMRVGIFALRDIAPGEELAYDYMFEHAGVSALAQGFRCMCGAPKCRGTMDANPERKRDYGRRIEVWWEGDEAWYPGTVTGYTVTNGRHVVSYDDGDVERLDLSLAKHRWLDGEGPSGARDGAAAAAAAAARKRGRPAGSAADVGTGSDGGARGARREPKPPPLALPREEDEDFQPLARRGQGGAKKKAKRRRRSDGGGAGGEGPRRKRRRREAGEGGSGKEDRSGSGSESGGESGSDGGGQAPELAAAMEQLVAGARGGRGGAGAGSTAERLASLALLAAHEDSERAAAAAEAAGAPPPQPQPQAKRRRGRPRKRDAKGEALLPMHQLLAGMRAVRSQGPPLFRAAPTRGKARGLLQLIGGVAPELGQAAACAMGGGGAAAGPPLFRSPRRGVVGGGGGGGDPAAAPSPGARRVAVPLAEQPAAPQGAEERPSPNGLRLNGLQLGPQEVCVPA